MTEMFLARCGFLDEFATPESYGKMEIIECSIDALREGAFDRRSIITTLSTTHSTFYEILDSVKEGLVKLAQRVLSALNNYYINNVKLFERYKEIIVRGLKTSNVPVVHETYEYPDCSDYPHVVRAALNEREIQQIHAQLAVRDYTAAEASFRVDLLLQKFSREVIGEIADISDLRGSTRAIVTENIRGPRTVTRITADNVEQFFRVVNNYRKDKEDVERTKKNMLDEYDQLKRTYKAVTENPDRRIEQNLRKLSDPDREDFMVHEYNRYADIHVEMMRLFNGYIAVYQTAFDTKLQLLEEKYFDYRNTLIELFTSTGAFTSMNKIVPKGSTRTIQYNPNRRGFVTT